MKRFGLTLMIVLVLPHSMYSQFQSRYSLFERTVTLQIDSSRSSYQLPDSFLIKNSERVQLDTVRLKRDVDYQIDYSAGAIFFLKPIPIHKTIRIDYQFLPLQIQRKSFHRELLFYSPPGKEQPIVQKLSDRSSRAPDAFSSLKQNGSIVRGITIGTNQGLKLESGLRMELSGKIADKVEVIAALTDQNTPIQPEGNTQTLQEIDKVFIQLKSDRFQATLGDYYLTFEGTEFSPYNRKLQGVMATAELGKSNVTLSGAVSRGKFTTNNFLGQEGNQGPYQLKGDRGQIDIIVLAGTEKVWLDGQAMIRGEDNDYVIEYSNGQITFTRRRLITADTRITVDFQYSDQRFQRSLYSANLASKMSNEKLKLNIRFLRESDNKSNLFDYSLTDANRSRLQLAGDQIDSAYVSGANYLGPGKGSYIAIDSAGVTFYRYVGPDAGDYNVAFNYVGSDNGAYKLIGYSNYQFVGSGNGSYNPVIFLTPPQNHDLADLELAYHPKQNLQIKTELALSRLDKNLFASKDDDDNAGMALTAKIGMNQQGIRLLGRNFGKFDLAGNYRQVQQNFQYIDRSEEVEKNRKWDLTDQPRRQEQIIELHGGYFPIDRMKFTGSIGENTRGSNFNSRRWEIGSELSIKKIPELKYQMESIDSRETNTRRTGQWLRQQGQTQYQFWKLLPGIQFQAETKKENFQDTLRFGFRYYEVAPTIKIPDWKKMSVTVGLTQRHQETYQLTGFTPESDARTQFVGWQLTNWKNLSLALEYTHRERSYADSSIGKKLTDLADFRADYSPFQRAITTNWHYQLSNTQVARQERIYIKVERGQGNYRYDEDLNEYIPDALTGDYLLRVRAMDEFVPIVELRASSTIKFQPQLLWQRAKQSESGSAWKKWLSAISSETFFQIEEKTSATDVWSIYRLDLSQFQQEAMTIFGTRNFRQDVFWNRNQSAFSLRVRYNQRSDLNNQYLEGGQRLNLVERQLRLKIQLSSKVSSQVDVENRLEKRSYKIPGRSDKDIFSNNVTLDLSFRPRQPLELALKTQLARAENRITNRLTVDYLSLSPRANIAFRGKGRLRAELEFNQVNVTPKNAIVPYEMVAGNREGTNVKWLAAFDYNVSRYIRASVNWNGRYEAYLKKPIYTVRAEMRAYF